VGPALRADASRGLAVAGVASLVVLILVLALRRATHQQVIAAARAEENRHLASLGEMSAVLAHQIRNPLAALKGHAQLLLETAAPGTKPHAKAERIVSEAERLEDLTNNLLEFVRAGERSLQQVDLGSVLRDAIGAVPGHSFELVVHQESVIGRADPLRLREALVNVLTNAKQASSEAVQVSLSCAGEVACIEVSDRGPGVPEEDREKIFKPFHTTRQRGTGLGLSVARRVVESHGGRVGVEARDGGGAVFKIYLPV